MTHDSTIINKGSKGFDPFVSPRELLSKARKGRYAIPGFLAHPPNFEHIKSIFDAAEEERSPFILQVNERGIEYAGLEYVIATAKILTRNASIPVVLHLDHGSSLQIIERCIRYGFSSVMIDGSSLSFKENIDLTKKVVELSHKYGVYVEAELGQLPSKTDLRARGLEGTVKTESTLGILTTSKDAARFIVETGVNSLTISIGTGHGIHAKINFKRLKEIAERTDAILVLHGGSGISEIELRKVIEKGISKVTFWTAMRKAFLNGLNNALNEPSKQEYPIELLRSASLEMKDVIKKCMKLCGSSNKA